MRTFFIGMLLIIGAFIAIPFLTGFLLHEGSFEYFLAVISAVFLLSGILLLFRVRPMIRPAIFLIAFSVITFLVSKEMIRWEGHNPFFSSYYFGGISFPHWTLILFAILLIALIIRRN